MIKPRLLRICTVPISLHVLLKGQLAFMQQHEFEVLTISSDGPERQEILNQSIDHQVVNMTRSITPIRDLLALVQIISIVLKFKPHIIHTHTPKAGLLGMLAAWICRVPVRLHTVAGLPLMEAKGVKRWVLKLTERITYSCSHRVYPNSIGLMNFIKLQIKDNSQIEVIGRGSSNGIDTNYFSRTTELEVQAKSIRNRYNIPEKAVVFSFVGRIVRDKGIIELVHAFKKLDNALHTRLLLVGPFEDKLDPLPEETMTYIRNDKRIIIAEFQQDVRPWIIASDIFVFPSYREGFPNAVMQASCLEIPCIVSDINGCNEIIQHGETGLLVPTKNATALLDAMVVLINDQEKRIAFGQKSREHVVRNFEQQFIWTALLKEYRKRLEEK